jgi:hypothetical protein
MLLSYAEVQEITMAVVDSPDPSSKNSSIDLVILAYMNDLVSNA